MTTNNLNNIISNTDLKEWVQEGVEKWMDNHFADLIGVNTNKPKQQNNPCEHCMNNPKNNPHASGVCYCILGTQKIMY